MTTAEKLYDDALDFAQKQEYTKAYALYNAAAELGYAPAQINLAMAYLNGKGVAQNDQAAFTWLQKAAEQNHPLAISNLGYCYSNGRGVAVDKYRALALYKQAADLGSEKGASNYKALLEDLYGSAAGNASQPAAPAQPTPPPAPQPQYQQPPVSQPQYQQSPVSQTPPPTTPAMNSMQDMKKFMEASGVQFSNQPAPAFQFMPPQLNVFSTERVAQLLKAYKPSWVPKLMARFNGVFIAFLIIFAFREFEGYPEIFLTLFGSFILICTTLSILFSFPHRKRYYKKTGIKEAIRHDSGNMQVAIKVYNAYPCKKSLNYIRSLNPAAAQLIDQQLAS